MFAVGKSVRVASSGRTIHFLVSSPYSRMNKNLSLLHTLHTLSIVIQTQLYDLHSSTLGSLWRYWGYDWNVTGISCLYFAGPVEDRRVMQPF